MVLKYDKSIRHEYSSNLVKIIRAELSGKLKDIKFYDGDQYSNFEKR